MDGLNQRRVSSWWGSMGWNENQDVGITMRGVDCWGYGIEVRR